MRPEYKPLLRFATADEAAASGFTEVEVAEPLAFYRANTFYFVVRRELSYRRYEFALLQATL